MNLTRKTFESMHWNSNVRVYKHLWVNMRRRWSPHERRPLAKYHVCMPSYEFYVSKLTMPVHCTRKKSSDSNLNGRFSFGHGCVAPSVLAECIRNMSSWYRHSRHQSSSRRATGLQRRTRQSIHSMTSCWLRKRKQTKSASSKKPFVRETTVFQSSRACFKTPKLSWIPSRLALITTCDGFRMRMSNLNLSSRP